MTRPGDTVFYPLLLLDAPSPILEGENFYASFYKWVFRLPDHSTCHAFPSLTDSGTTAAFVHGYGGGSATDFHRFPY